MSVNINGLVTINNISFLRLELINLFSSVINSNLSLMIGYQQVEWPRLLPKYPNHLTKEEKEQCERMAILTLNMFIDNPGGPDKRIYHWSKHFWNHNLKLSPCITNVLMKDDGFIEITEDFINELNEYTDDNMKSLKKYLFDDLKDFKYDLYDPTKDEVIIGLFSRILRLCIAFLKAPELWMGGFSTNYRVISGLGSL